MDTSVRIVMAVPGKIVRTSDEVIDAHTARSEILEGTIGAGARHNIRYCPFLEYLSIFGSFRH